MHFGVNEMGGASQSPLPLCTNRASAVSLTLVEPDRCGSHWLDFRCKAGEAVLAFQVKTPSLIPVTIQLRGITC